MKKQLTFFFLLWFSTFTFAQSQLSFPNINYPTLDGSLSSSDDVFTQKELSVVVFWAPNGHTIRQMQGIDQAIDGWREKYDVQVVVISMERNLATKPRKAIEGFIEKGQYTKDGYIILVDELVKADNNSFRLKYSSSVPVIDGSSPHTLLVSKAGNIIASLKGLRPHEELEQKVADYFE